MKQLTLIRLAIGAVGFALYAPNAGAIPIYAFSSDRVELIITGGKVVPLFTNTVDSAHLVQQGVDYGKDQHDDNTDAAQAASGPAKAPPENFFKSVGANAGLARADVLVDNFGVIGPNTAVGRNVAETYLAGAGSGSGAAEDEIDFRVVQTGTAAIRFLMIATPTLSVSTTAAGDSSVARLSAALEVFDPTGARKALWVPCGSTANAADKGANNCANPGNGLTVDPAFAGTVNVLLDPFSLNIAQTCADANCTKNYQPGAGAGRLGAFLMTVDVGQNNNIFADLDMSESVLVSGTQKVNNPEPGTLLLFVGGGVLIVLGRWRKRRSPSESDLPPKRSE